MLKLSFPVSLGILVLLIGTGCGEDSVENGQEAEHCGNGVIDPGEDCDGEDLGGMTCEELGFYFGELVCSQQCTFDASGCHGYCGDGSIHAERGEECDGEDLGGVTCEDLGFEGGALSCGDDCRYDTSECLGDASALHDLFGDTLVDADGEAVETSSLVGKKIGIYFTTGWCGPCLGFTPILVDVYHELRDENKPFGVVSVSWDHSEEDMFDYMQNYDMPWKAVPFHGELRQSLNVRYEVTGVPTLIIIDWSGETISTAGRVEVEEHGAAAYDLW